MPSVGTKLITQNLLMSAALYETPHALDWASIQDLCVLINLFCLYDNVVVLGRQANPVQQRNDSGIYEVLSDQEFVQVHEVTDKKTTEEISRVARSHLRSVLRPGTDTSLYDSLMKRSLHPSEVVFGLTRLPDQVQPDQVQDFGFIPEWLVDEPSYDEFLSKLENRNNVPRSYTFMARTFLYLGYSDVKGLSFTPDTARVPVVEQICRSEEDSPWQIAQHAT